jgi:hypothetical protein
MQKNKNPEEARQLLSFSEILPHSEKRNETITAMQYVCCGILALFLSFGGKTDLNLSLFSSDSLSIERIEIEGPSAVDEDSTAYYSCKAYYDDGRSEDITASASWSEDCWYADISSGGRLTTGVVTADETCRISAIYDGLRDSFAISIKNSVKAVARLEVDGPGEVNENEPAYFKCWAYYDDGSCEDVSDVADWTEDSWHASFESDGKLVTGSVNSNTWVRFWVRFKGLERSFDVRILNNIRAIIRLEISGPGEIKEKSSAYYVCMAFFDDGGTEDISSAVSWTEDSWYAEVSSGGRVSTDEVEEDQWFRLVARYGGQEAFLEIKIVNVS